MISPLASVPAISPVTPGLGQPFGAGEARSANSNARAERGEEAVRPTTSVESDSTELSDEDARVIRELQARDREVRDHENAHRAVGGDLVRGGGYEYQIGPDGQRYAIGGDVQIDTSEVPNDPQATVNKMDRVVRAALAPAEPSSQDLAVAAQARATRNEAAAQALEENGVSDAASAAQNAEPTSTNPLTRQYQQVAGFDAQALAGSASLARA